MGRKNRPKVSVNVVDKSTQKVDTGLKVLSAEKGPTDHKPPKKENRSDTV